MHRHILYALNGVISVACPANGLRAVRHAGKTDAYRDGGGIKHAVRHASAREGGIPAIQTE